MLLASARPLFKGRTFWIGLPMYTDNQGNGHILSKCFTTKQPAASVLMCMSKFYLASACAPIVQWRSREENTWADALANGTFCRV